MYGLHRCEYKSVGEFVEFFSELMIMECAFLRKSAIVKENTKWPKNMAKGLEKAVNKAREEIASRKAIISVRANSS